jgi:hypothetical protein
MPGLALGCGLYAAALELCFVWTAGQRIREELIEPAETTTFRPPANTLLRPHLLDGTSAWAGGTAPS